MGRLLFAARHFDAADATVAEEAFLEFAKATDEEVSQAACKLAPERLRKLVGRAEQEAEQLSLFAYLLGACGDASDADRLQALARRGDPQTAKALEGILAGYITLRPKEGWALTYELLGDEKQSFLVRYATVRTLRFLHNTRPVESRSQVLHGLRLMIPQAELADMAISDLCKWKVWDHTALVLAQYGKASHETPIVKNSIVRYALTCPLPEARSFVDRLRKQDPDLVRDIEDDLRFAGGE